MPCTSHSHEHRPKLQDSALHLNACVARPVGKAELGSTPAAQAATKTEWDRLRAKKVWDEHIVREWDDVAKEARQAGIEANLGYLFGICTEKKTPNNPRDTLHASSKDAWCSRATGSSVRTGNVPCSKISVMHQPPWMLPVLLIVTAVHQDMPLKWQTPSRHTSRLA